MRIWSFPSWAVVAVMLLTVGGVVFRIEYRDPTPKAPLSAAEAQQAQSRLAQTTTAPGFRLGGSPRAQGDVCFVSAAGDPMTAHGYVGLARAFGVALSTERCDQTLTAPATGRAIQLCDGYGEFQQWVIATTLAVTSDGHGNDQTQINFAPVRRG